MLSSFATQLAVALLAASPPATGELAQLLPDGAVASITLPAEQFQDIVLEALPPAPSIIVRETRYYGNVTIDHRLHLARKARCKSCHGPGAITKLTFTPKEAHERCIGCHQEWSKGPTACQDCHFKPLPKRAPKVVAAAARPPAIVEPPAPDPENLSAAMAAFDRPRSGRSAKEPFHRALEVSVIAGSGWGFGARVASHQNFLVLTQSVERLVSGDDKRTLALLGGGMTRPLNSRLKLEAIGLVGLDAVDSPLLALLPAVGGRLGIEWQTRMRFMRQINAAVSAVQDLSRRRAFDRDVGGLSVYGTVSTGFSFPPR